MAEEQVESQENTEQQASNDGAEQGKGGKTYTQDDINRMMSAQAKKLNADFETKLANASKVADEERQDLMNKGAERAKMTADQRAKAELADERKQMQKQKDEFAKRMQAFDERQAISDTKEQLIDAGLSKDFAKYLSSTDVDTRMGNVTDFTKLFNQAVDAKVQERLTGKKNPETSTEQGSQQSNSDVRIPKTADEFWHHMSQAEQRKALKARPKIQSELHLF